MTLLNQKTKQYIFAAAGRKVSTKTVVKKARPSYPASGGMFSAAAATTPSNPTKKKRTTKTVPSTTHTVESPISKPDVIEPKTNKSSKNQKFNGICREVSKYGSIALATMTLVNHGVSTFHKFAAAVNEDQELYQQYVESSRSYIKPHFSLPSDWYHARMTFGTPWYF